MTMMMEDDESQPKQEDEGDEGGKCVLSSAVSAGKGGDTIMGHPVEQVV